MRIIRLFVPVQSEGLVTSAQDVTPLSVILVGYCVFIGS